MGLDTNFGIEGSSLGKIPASLLTHFLSINKAKKLAARLAGKKNPCGETCGTGKRLVARPCGKGHKLVVRLVAKVKG